MNDDLFAILLLEDGLDGESRSPQNGELKLDPWCGAQTMVDDRPTTCVREIARRWLVARDGGPLPRPAFDVRSTTRVGRA